MTFTYFLSFSSNLIKVFSENVDIKGILRAKSLAFLVDILTWENSFYPASLPPMNVMYIKIPMKKKDKSKKC